ncbi:MAG: hypothetical protein KGL52_00015 [Rhodospirillales bacterium]|jgi:hypothetical protein|nr:hypothetical protein [Rhodospirillales bacterium]
MDSLIFAALAAILLTVTAAAPAQARVRVFFGFGAPVWGWGPGPYYYPPPVYYPPPIIYAPPPPPMVYAPPDAGPAPFARSCDAGAYVCPLERALPAGSRCWCRDNGGRRVYGQAG